MDIQITHKVFLGAFNVDNAKYIGSQHALNTASNAMLYFHK